MMLRPKIVTIFITIALLSVSCKSNPNTQNNVDSTKIQLPDTLAKLTNIEKSLGDDTLYALVGKIDEVKKLIETTNKTSLDKKVSVMIAKRPDEKFPYYWVQVGVDDKNRFQPVYNFYVNPKTSDIKFYDTVNDSVITIDEWRKMRGW
jgi:hypothetical protein